MTMDNIRYAKSDWSNADGSQYYETLPIKEFECIARVAGIEAGCDVDYEWQVPGVEWWLKKHWDVKREDD